MLFNSFEFFLFLPLVYVIYWLLGRSKLKIQNVFLLLASYVFYGWWDYRFLSLILFSTVVDYLVGLQLPRSEKPFQKKVLLWISLICNVGLLGFFKYYNFFLDSFIDTFSFFGYQIENVWTLKIILPVGISFYTFQTLSYSIDVYRGELKPTRNFVSFATFVSFFPQLVAGPIERAYHLLPQIEKKREFNYIQHTDGLRLILWGLFKKVAIADSLSPMVDDIFSNPGEHSSSTLLMGAVFFGFQIYGDFSGYSDIAIGTAKLFGIELMSNFRFPYFSRNIAEFWRRWHISLSAWFTEYLYIPLGGSKTTKPKAIRNVFVVFLVSGLWHGANWTFVFWGFFHSMLFVPLYITGNNKRYRDTVDLFGSSFSRGFREVIQILLTFSLVTIGWVFFRSETLSESIVFLQRMFSELTWDKYMHPRGYRLLDYFILLAFFVFIEYMRRNHERTPLSFKNKWVRFGVYCTLLFLVLLFYDDGADKSFIYFQF